MVTSSRAPAVAFGVGDSDTDWPLGDLVKSFFFFFLMRFSIVFWWFSMCFCWLLMFFFWGGVLMVFLVNSWFSRSFQRFSMVSKGGSTGFPGFQCF